MKEYARDGDVVYASGEREYTLWYPMNENDGPAFLGPTAPARAHDRNEEIRAEVRAPPHESQSLHDGRRRCLGGAN